MPLGFDESQGGCGSTSTPRGHETATGVTVGAWKDWTYFLGRTRWPPASVRTTGVIVESESRYTAVF